MKVTVFAAPVIVILAMLLIGFILGVGITLILYRRRRQASSDSLSAPVAQRDPSNPYEPSSVGLQKPKGNIGCALAVAGLIIVAIIAIALVATFLFTATSVVRTIPGPPPPPTTVVQPQQAPTSN